VVEQAAPVFLESPDLHPQPAGSKSNTRVVRWIVKSRESDPRFRGHCIQAMDAVNALPALTAPRFARPRMAEQTEAP
jgi:hypothetical protein